MKNLDCNPIYQLRNYRRRRLEKKNLYIFFNKRKYKNLRTMHRALSRISCKLKIRKYFLVSLKLNNKIDNKNKLFFYFFFFWEVKYSFRLS